MTTPAMYEAEVLHRRRNPEHAIRRRLTLAYLDVDEMSSAGSSGRGWSTFRRSDYLDGSDRPLRDALDDVVSARVGRHLHGPVRMLTMLRTGGWLFNPLTTYFAFDQDDTALELVVLEITNTPWHERFWYVLDAEQVAGRGQPFQKDFHVSPFLPMDLTYRCATSAPAEDLSLTIELTRLDDDGREQPVFDASLSGRRVEPHHRPTPDTAIRRAAQTLGVSTGIYGHAAVLAARGAPFHRHPAAEPSRVTTAERPPARKNQR